MAINDAKDDDIVISNSNMYHNNENIDGGAKLSFQVRLSTTCEAIIGEFEDAEMEVMIVWRYSVFDDKGWHIFLFVHNFDKYWNECSE